MAKKKIEEEEMVKTMEESEEDSDFDTEEDDDDDQELDFDAGDDLLLDDEEDDDDDIVPTVLSKGISRPKTDEDWRQLLMDASQEGTPYSITEAYEEGALVIHPMFGLGVVSKVVTPTKMALIFETDKRLFAMNTSPPEQV